MTYGKQPLDRATIQRRHRQRKNKEAEALMKIGIAAAEMLFRLRCSSDPRLEHLRNELPTDDAIALLAISARIQLNENPPSLTVDNFDRGNEFNRRHWWENQIKPKLARKEFQE